MIGSLSRLTILATLTALTLLAAACRDDVPSAAEHQEAPRAGVPALFDGPAFWPITYHASPYRRDEFTAGVGMIVPADGGSYGLSNLLLFCDDDRPEIGIYYLPPTAQDQFTVSLSLDGAPSRQLDWAIDNTYIDTSGSGLISPIPAQLLAELAQASRAVIHVPQLGVGPAEFDLQAMFTAPVGEQIARCGEKLPRETIAMPADYQPLTDVFGEVGGVAWRSETLANNRVQTTISHRIPQVVTPLGPLEFRVGCDLRGYLHVELGNLPAPEPVTPAYTHSGGLPEVEVTLSLDQQPTRVETWGLYLLSDDIQARAHAPYPLILGMLHSTTLHIAVPDLNIPPFAVDLSQLFSTPLQDNLSHCGYYAAAS